MQHFDIFSYGGTSEAFRALILKANLLITLKTIAKVSDEVFIIYFTGLLPIFYGISCLSITSLASSRFIRAKLFWEHCMLSVYKAFIYLTLKRNVSLNSHQKQRIIGLFKLSKLAATICFLGCIYQTIDILRAFQCVFNIFSIFFKLGVIFETWLCKSG